MTAPGQMLEYGPSSRSPTTYANSETNAVGSIFGDLSPSVLIIGVFFNFPEDARRSDPKIDLWVS